MTIHTRVSAKGQVVIPKGVRDRLQFAPGTELTIEESGDGVFLRPVRKTVGRLTVEEFIARRPPYNGPRISIEEMKLGIEREAARRWKAEDSSCDDE